jgi:hypothetical protein
LSLLQSGIDVLVFKLSLLRIDSILLIVSLLHIGIILLMASLWGIALLVLGILSCSSLHALSSPSRTAPTRDLVVHDARHLLSSVS